MAKHQRAALFLAAGATTVGFAVALVDLRGVNITPFQAIVIGLIAGVPMGIYAFVRWEGL